METRILTLSERTLIIMALEMAKYYIAGDRSISYEQFIQNSPNRYMPFLKDKQNTHNRLTNLINEIDPLTK